MPQKFKVALHEMRGQMLEKNNEGVKLFLDSAAYLLKGKGWKYEGQKIRSAMYERTYVRNGFSITLCGWHGNGKPGGERFYGAGKSFFSLYYCEGYKTKSNIDVDIHNSDTFEELIAVHAAGMAKALQFIAEM